LYGSLACKTRYGKPRRWFARELSLDNTIVTNKNTIVLVCISVAADDLYSIEAICVPSVILYTTTLS
jgi:hypothetical protein